MTWDDFGDIGWSVHNTLVASDSQMCVQYQSSRDHSDVSRGEYDIPVFVRESTGQNSVAESRRERQELRSRESRCRSRNYRRITKFRICGYQNLCAVGAH